MKKSETIKSKEEFSYLIKNSKYLKTKEFIIYYNENNLSKKRFGIAISNKIGNAVTRNKLKIKFKNNKDYIIMIRKACLETSFSNRLKNLEEKLEEIK